MGGRLRYLGKDIDGLQTRSAAIGDATRMFERQVAISGGIAVDQEARPCDRRDFLLRQGFL